MIAPEQFKPTVPAREQDAPFEDLLSVTNRLATAKIIELSLSQQLEHLRAFVATPENFAETQSEGLLKDITSIQDTLREYTRVIAGLEQSFNELIEETKKVAHLRQ